MTNSTPEQFGKQSADVEEELFLEGPRSRFKELRSAIRIFLECIKGFRSFHFVGPCVTVFGSARVDSSHPFYALAEEVGYRLARAGFTVVTGGGPGIMEASNKGAKRAGGVSLGCNIILPREQKTNAFLDRWVEFRYFFIRKLILAKYSYAFVVLPGGFGTMDELFEVATLIQTGKMHDFPVVLMGKEYWQGLLAFLHAPMCENHFIEEKDLNSLFVTDSAEEAVALIRSAALKKFGVKSRSKIKSSRMLNEKPIVPEYETAVHKALGNT